jgi:integrase/recombinase XerC
MYDLSHFCCWWVNECGEPFSPEQMNIMDLRSYRAWMVDEVRCAPSTWERRRASLAMFCEFAHKKYKLNMPKVNTLPLMPVVELAPKSLSKQERNRIMKYLTLSIDTNYKKEKFRPTTGRERWLAMRNRALFALMAYSGLRVGEAVQLQLADLTLGERKGWVHIHGSIAKRGTTGDVPVPLIARDFLQDWLQIRKEMPIRDSKLLFPAENGEELTTRAVQKTVLEVSARTGIRFTAHSLRHTTLTQVLDAGSDVRAVQAIGRHKKLETSLRYTRLSEDDLFAAAERGAVGR